MATLQTLGVDSLSLRGAGTEYNSLSRVFKTKAEADAALASGDWTPVAGRMNLCVTGDQGVLRVDENGALVTADAATRAYIDAEITRIVGDAPAVLDSLGELSDAISDDPDFFATMASANTTLQEAINTEVSRATAAEQAIQNDVDANEQAATDAAAAELARATAAEAAIQADVDQNEADADAAIAAEEARALAAEAAIQADVDANEAAQNADIAAEAARAGAAEAAIQADVDQNEADADAAIAALQADVDQNEADADAAIAAEEARALAAEAAIQADVDANETAANAAIAAVQADVDQNESDADAAIAVERGRIDAILAGADADKDTFAEIVTLINSVDTTNDNAFAAYVLSNDAAVAAVQADVDQNEADADAAISAEENARLSGDASEASARQAADNALGVRINDVETEIDTARTNIYAALGRAEGVQTMGTFTGSTLGDNETVKNLLQSLETATEGEITARTAIAEFASNLTKLKNDLRGTYINVGNNIEIRPAPGGRVEIVGDLYLDNNTAIDGAGTTLTSFANINAYDGRIAALEADPTTAAAVAAVQADVDQNEADADAAIAVERGRIDAILAGADADKDTFAEIVTLINSVDTANDNAFAAYVLSNDAAVAAVQADVDQNEADADAAIALKLDASAVSAFGLTLVDDADAATARTTLGLGTAATTDATAYATAAQGATADAALAASAVSAFGLTLVDDADAATARTTLGVDAAGTDNSTDVTLAAGLDYLTIAGQEITLGSVDLTTDVTGALPVANGGTGATDAAGARTALGLGSAATTDSTDYATAAQGATADAALPAAGAQAALSVDHLITLSGVAEGSDDFGTFTGSTIGDNLALKAILQAVETAVEARLATTGVTTLLSEYANDGAAETGGVPVGGLYYDGNGHVRVRLV